MTKSCCQICGGNIKRRIVKNGYWPKEWDKSEIYLATKQAFPTTLHCAEKFWGKGNFVKVRIEYQEIKAREQK
jgi:hypothetical protein